MSKSTSSTRHYENILTSIATVSVSQVPGVLPLSTKKRGLFGIGRSRASDVEVYIEGGRVTFDISIYVRNECRVPDVVYSIQERIKREVESATIFKIRSINVRVVGVVFAS